MTEPRVLRLSSVFEGPPVTRPGFDPVGGQQGHAAELTRAVDALGVAQTVVTAVRPGAPPTEAIGERSTVIRVGVPIPALRQLYAAPALRTAMRLAADADVVHAHMGEDLAVLPIARAAARKFRLPMVMTIHCSLRHTLRAMDARSLMLWAVGGRIEEAATRRADAVVVISSRMAERLVTAGVHPARVRVIPPGIDREAFAGPFRDPLPVGRRIVFVGRLVGAKGVDLLLQAFARGAPPDAHLVFVGDGPLRPALSEGARRAGVGERVHFTGFVRPTDVASHLAHAAVAVLPSRYEELGRVILEAMHLGVPVVASNTGGIPEVVEHGRTGLLVPRGDVPALAEAIHRVLTEPVLERRLRDGARMAADRRTWESSGRAHLDLYRALTTRARGRALLHAAG